MQQRQVSTFAAFLRRNFHVDLCSTHKDLVTCGLKAVQLGLLHKNSVNEDGICLAIVLIEYASFDDSLCLPTLRDFFDTKPCLYRIWACLRLHRRTPTFSRICMSMDYLWSNPLATKGMIADFCLQMYSMDIQIRWSPCRVAWICAVVR
jgi:hypothetical protein